MRKGDSLHEQQCRSSRVGGIVIWYNRRCTKDLFGEQPDGVAVAKTIYEETRMLFVGSGRFPNSDLFDIKKAGTTQRTLYQRGRAMGSEF